MGLCRHVETLGRDQGLPHLNTTESVPDMLDVQEATPALVLDACTKPSTVMDGVFGDQANDVVE
jgi:hypothetical protein